MTNKILTNHADDLAAIAIKKGFCATKFLTPAEASGLTVRFAGRKDVRVEVEGGHKDAERVRLVFVNPEWGEWEREEVVALLRITWRPPYEVGHRDVLGAVMNLGIARETVGDIWIREPKAFLVCVPEMAEYIKENVTKIGNVGVAVKRVAWEELPDVKESMETRTITLSSNRLDAFIGGVWGVSRSDAQKFVTQGRVRVGHKECLKPDKELGEGELVSVRGLGRAKFLALEGRTRKERLRIQIGIPRRQ